MVAVVKDRDSDPKATNQSLGTLIESRADGYLDVCRGLLKDAHINVIAAEGLATSDDPVLARELIARYRNFRAPTRPGVISILVSRTSFAIELMKAIESGKIGKDAVSAYQIRQLRNLNDSELEKLLAEVWGAVAETPQQLAAQIEELRLRLEPGTIANADLSVGRKLFSQACATCHKLYGEGQNIGPDLTGANRTNLSYLLENIVSPSSVVDASYRMTQVLTVDGQLVGGLKIRETEEVIEIRTAEKTITLPTDEVEVIRLTDQSPMPTGLLDPMTSDQVRDLIGYLMHSTQVALP
ncbi:MAG: c-type cytochrome [Planctomycetota bacterium]